MIDQAMADIESPPAPPEPPVYTWHPHGGSQPWLPGPSTTPADPERHSPTAPHRRREGGIAGAVAAGAAAFFKYGILLLKLGKLGPTLISMVIAFFFYAVFFGPIFGVGLVLLILVHELGHVAFSRYEGLPMTAPVFLGPFGAVTGMKRPPKDARQEAVIALGGPLVGIAAAIAIFAWAELLQPGYWQSLLLALSYFGFFLNLFNLIPMSPLDGGRIATAVSLWLNVVGLVIMAAVVLFLGNPFALIIFILGLITTIQRFRNARRGLEPAAVPPRTRLIIGIVWLAMLAIAAGGMSVAHTAQINSNTVPGVTRSTGSA
jgi:Zn-dependent protease